jgi:hypothetical protein
MPYFDDNPLEQLAFQAGDAEALLDLQGLSAEQAMQAVEKLLLEPASAKSFLIRFDAAGDDGRETLFQPLGRRLLQARREGRLNRCLPASDGAGYFIIFAD